MDDNRSTDPGVARIIAKARDLNRKRLRERLRAFRRTLRSETMATMMLGSGSLALAVVMTIVTALGLLGISFQAWSKPRVFPVTSGTATVLTKILVPSDDCAVLAFLGLIFGGMGIALSVKQRKFSWLSAIGFTLTLVMMLIVVAYGMLMGG